MQKTVEVYRGDQLLTIIPKENEKTFREAHAGTEDERNLRFVDPEKKAQIEKERAKAMKFMEDQKREKESAKDNKIAELEAQLEKMKKEVKPKTKANA